MLSPHASGLGAVVVPLRCMRVIGFCSNVHAAWEKRGSCGIQMACKGIFISALEESERAVMAPRGGRGEGRKAAGVVCLRQRGGLLRNGVGA